MGIGFTSTENLETRTRTLFLSGKTMFSGTVHPVTPFCALLPVIRAPHRIYGSLRTVIIFQADWNLIYIRMGTRALAKKPPWPLRCREYMLLHGFLLPTYHPEIPIPVSRYYSGPRGVGPPPNSHVHSQKEGLVF
jgi:hypothetical protein